MNKELAINILRGSVLGTNEQLHEAVFMAIKALKTEPKHGRWLIEKDEYGDDWCKCSECGYINIGCEVFSMDGFKYCPNCGARMDGGENG